MNAVHSRRSTVNIQTSAESEKNVSPKEFHDSDCYSLSILTGAEP